MSGRILSNTYPATVTLSSSADQPATITSTGLLQAGLYGTGFTAWDVTNQGTVFQGTGTAGIALSAGGTVTNASTGSIFGTTYGVALYGGVGTVFNSGTITASNSDSDGVELRGGGMVTNQSGGLIDGGLYAIDSSNLATIVNHGTIGVAAEIGVGLSSGMVTNDAGATIQGTRSGVRIFVGGSVVNAGTISAGGDAVHFYGVGGTAQLTVDPGAVFNGLVDGGDTGVSGLISTLELASGGSVGTLSGLGLQYTNFSQIVVDGDASWLLNDSNTLSAGVTLTDDGLLDVAGTLDSGGMIDIGAAATLDVQGTITGGTIDFTGANGLLQAGDPVDFAAGITDFTAGDTIDLTSLSFVTGASASIAGGILSVTSGTITDTLHVSGIVDGTAFRTVQDQSGTGTDVSLLCFLAGTRIATPTGEIPVEQLRVGELVLTRDGRRLPITWIGAGRSILPAGTTRSDATPVIVRAGALADGVPSRDLRLTKGHSLFLDGVLIPVEFLINHRSILWDDTARVAEIYHIELASHEVLLADGAPAESYRDDGNRRLFQNGNLDWDRVPLPSPCAPIVIEGPQLVATWQRLMGRARDYSTCAVTDNSDLHLLVDGVRVDVVAKIDDTWRFTLAAPIGIVRIVSRAASPAELGVGHDQRRLGVALRRAALSQGGGLRVLKAADARLTQGFHGFEPAEGWRWTDGDATLPAELFHGLRGMVTLELSLAFGTGYPAAAARAA